MFLFLLNSCNPKVRTIFFLVKVFYANWTNKFDILPFLLNDCLIPFKRNTVVMVLLRVEQAFTFKLCVRNISHNITLDVIWIFNSSCYTQCMYVSLPVYYVGYTLICLLTPHSGFWVGKQNMFAVSLSNAAGMSPGDRRGKQSQQSGMN